MGLFRKAMSVSSLGVVSYHSKDEKVAAMAVAKAKEAKANTKLLKAQLKEAKRNAK
jgi:hypothetical protein